MVSQVQDTFLIGTLLKLIFYLGKYEYDKMYDSVMRCIINFGILSLMVIGIENGNL